MLYGSPSRIRMMTYPFITWVHITLRLSLSSWQNHIEGRQPWFKQTKITFSDYLCPRIETRLMLF